MSDLRGGARLAMRGGAMRYRHPNAAWNARRRRWRRVWKSLRGGEHGVEVVILKATQRGSAVKVARMKRAGRGSRNSGRPAGTEAARRLELTTQVPTHSVFVTSGPSKRIRVGKMEIRLQHVCQRKLALAGRPAGLALAAMWYLGKTEVTPALVEKIRRKLGSSEFEVLKSATSSMPAWMSDAIFRNVRTSVHA